MFSSSDVVYDVRINRNSILPRVTYNFYLGKIIKTVIKDDKRLRV